MATAPRPGTGRRKQATEDGQKVLRITVQGATYSFCPGNIPFEHAIAVRKACGGLPFSAFWGGELTVDVDSLKVMYWVARRVSGESNLQLQTVLDEWPDTLNPADFEVVLEDPNENEDDPE